MNLFSSNGFLGVTARYRNFRFPLSKAVPRFRPRKEMTGTVVASRAKLRGLRSLATTPNEINIEGRMQIKAPRNASAAKIPQMEINLKELRPMAASTHSLKKNGPKITRPLFYLDEYAARKEPSMLKLLSNASLISLLSMFVKILFINMLLFSVMMVACKDEITIRIKDRQIIRMSSQLAGERYIRSPYGAKIVSQRPVILSLPTVHRTTANLFIAYIGGVSDDMGLDETNFSEFLVLAQNVLGAQVRSSVFKKMCEYLLYEDNLGAVMLNEYLLDKERHKNAASAKAEPHANAPPRVLQDNPTLGHTFEDFLNDVVSLFSETIPQVRDILFVKYTKIDEIMPSMHQNDNLVSVYRKEVDKKAGFTESELAAYGYDLKSHFNKLLLLSYDGRDLFEKVDYVFHKGRKHWLMGNELVDNVRKRVKVIKF